MLTEEQFLVLAEAHLDMVYRIALNWFRSPADAEDAAQEVMLRLWRSPPRETEGEGLRYWLARVTVNVCKNMQRAFWRRRTVPLETCEYLPAAPPEERELLEEVMGLPGKYRVPLYLHYYEGYTAREIGALLGRNPSTVQTQLARGRELLRVRWKEE